MKDFNPKHLPAFKDWLTARGASVLANTNQLELELKQPDLGGAQANPKLYSQLY